MAYDLNTFKLRLQEQILKFQNEGSETEIPEPVLKLLIDGNNHLLKTISNIEDVQTVSENLDIIEKMLDKNDKLIKRMFKTDTNLKIEKA